MSRRTQPAAGDFGADSFLDVVCNIVGILIILIVIVAVKVQRQPQPLASEITEAASEKADLDLRVASLQSDLSGFRKSLSESENTGQTLKREVGESEARLQQLTDVKDLLLRKSVDENERLTLQKQQAEDASQETRRVAARVATLQERLADRSRETQNLLQLISVAEATQQDLAEKTRLTIAETLRLEEVFEGVNQSAAPDDRLQHRLAPVTRAADKGELHFRVSAGRISRVPLEELLERLKAQVLSRRTAVMRFNQFEGTVGPVQGYMMQYTVEREGPTPVEALQYGERMTRVNVSRWQIDPDASLMDETVAEAARPGSRYRQTIETAVPDTVVTIWIYPDSFSVFPQLRELAHALQLRVAARPLPEGTPIVGSPTGSRSNAQ